MGMGEDEGGQPTGCQSFLAWHLYSRGCQKKDEKLLHMPAVSHTHLK